MLKGKRLLLMGGISLACDIVKRSKDMGVWTIVTDYNEDSPAKKIADESFMVSTTDVDALVALCESEQIDGVFTNYIDSLLPYAQQVCVRLGKPFYVDKRQIEIISNKREAKYLCMAHQIHVPREYHITLEFDEDALSTINYPVLTKPVDNSGQRGISVCRNETELVEGYRKALRYSPRGDVLVEEYLSGDYVVICFTLQNGYLSLSAMADKPVYDDDGSGEVKIPKGYILPSRYIDLFYRDLYPKFKRLASRMKLKNGSFSVEAVVSENKFYVFEMQLRLGGMKHHEFVLKENGIDILGMHIRHALTGQFSGWDIEVLDNPKFSNTYCLLNLVADKGKIASVSGVKDVCMIPGVSGYLQMMQEGEVVEATGTVEQIFAKISIETKTNEDLNKVIGEIGRKLHVVDEAGEQMLKNLPEVMT